MGKSLLPDSFPTWLAVEDRGILQGYFEGDKSAFERFWTAEYLNAWLTPILAWTALGNSPALRHAPA